jgi:glycosyltransferase involved in cell wall biosynthesis
VSPLRALLAAQAQSTWNRLRREGGEASVVAAVLVAVVAAAAMTPPVGACFVAGRSYGRGLAAGESLAAGLTALLSDPVARDRSGRAAQERARSEYLWDSVANAYEALLAGS